MSKLNILWLIGLAMIVVACGGQAPTTPTAAPTPVNAIPPTAVQAAPPTAVAASPTAAAAPTQPSGGLAVTPAGVSGPPKLDPAGMCQVAAAPEPVPGFPATLPADQVRGQANSPAVLYEYSDFQ